MIGNVSNLVNMQPILPNLITSTDEVTIFASVAKVNSKESLYLSARPEEVKNEMISSGYRNNYAKKISGDAHCRGVRTVLNNTFAAGGLSAPVFVTVYGMSREEMPGSEFVTIPVEELAVGSHQDLCSKGVEYITFVRGKTYWKERYTIQRGKINCFMCH